jgi:hypothetical protein
MVQPGIDAVLAGTKAFAVALLAPVASRLGARPRVAGDPAQVLGLCSGPHAIAVIEFLGEGSLSAIQALVRDGNGMHVVAGLSLTHGTAEQTLRALGVEVAAWDGKVDGVIRAIDRVLAGMSPVPGAPGVDPAAVPSPPAAPPAAPARPPGAMPPAGVVRPQPAALAAARPAPVASVPAPPAAAARAPSSPGTPGLPGPAAAVAARPSPAAAPRAPTSAASVAPGQVTPAAPSSPPGKPAAPAPAPARPAAPAGPGSARPAQPGVAPAPAAPRPVAISGSTTPAVPRPVPAASPASMSPLRTAPATAAPRANPAPVASPPRPPAAPRAPIAVPAAPVAPRPAAAPASFTAPAPAAPVAPRPADPVLSPTLAPAPAGLSAFDVLFNDAPEADGLESGTPPGAAPVDLHAPGIYVPPPAVAKATWPAEGHTSAAAEAALRRALDGDEGDTDPLLVAAHGVLGSLSDLERAVLAGVPQSVDVEPIRSAAVMRVRVATALAATPPPGSEVDGAALSGILGEIDALLARVGALAVGAEAELKPSLESIRNALVREAIDFSETAQRIGALSAAPEAAKPMVPQRAAQARVLSVGKESEADRADRRRNTVLVAVLGLLLIGAVAFHGVRYWEKSQLVPPPPPFDAPAGFQVRPTAGTRGPVTLHPTGVPIDRAALQRFREAQEAQGKQVVEMENGVVLVLPPGVPLPDGAKKQP